MTNLDKRIKKILDDIIDVAYPDASRKERYEYKNYKINVFILVGRKVTSTLIDGESITDRKDLDKLGVLRLVDCEKLEDSYIRLKYEVVK